MISYYRFNLFCLVLLCRIDPLIRLHEVPARKTVFKPQDDIALPKGRK